jgi:tripartite-type tricarboxylate transporter receptor subunit TctC
VAPAGTPSDIVLRMNRETNNVLQDAEVAQKLEEIGVSSGGAETPEAFGRFMRSEDERWEKIVREIGLEPE